MHVFGTITLAHLFLLIGILLLSARMILPYRPDLEKLERAIFVSSIVILVLGLISIVYALYTYSA